MDGIRLAMYDKDIVRTGPRRWVTMRIYGYKRQAVRSYVTKRRQDKIRLQKDVARTAVTSKEGMERQRASWIGRCSHQPRNIIDRKELMK